MAEWIRRRRVGAPPWDIALESRSKEITSDSRRDRPYLIDGGDTEESLLLFYYFKPPQTEIEALG